MGHTPFGYRIENGIAIIDKPAAAKLRLLYKNYLSGMSLSKAAAEAGIPTYHGTAKRLMETVHYLGDSFYPAIILNPNAYVAIMAIQNAIASGLHRSAASM